MSPIDTLSASEALPHGKVHYRSGAGVALLTLVNPPANGYSHEMMSDLDAAILRARFDDSVQVIVLAGAGEKFFCAGADIAMLSRLTPTQKYHFCLHANETLQRLERTPKLVIAALSGHCVGGGLEIALAADLRLARRGSGKCGLPEVALGVLPGTGGTQRLARLLGRAKAIELMTSGRTFDYDEALALGVVTEVRDAADDASFLELVLSHAKSFTTPGRAAMSVGHIKAAVHGGVDLPLDAGLALERELQAKLFASLDAKEGIAAYIEKRPAQFQGK
ncbi:MAG: enoyl-CoA hydratase/isomerase family protein [Planctomycetes bacterium]|nr:enoyl-CoA hydratase/isomerase family protein [Planctomycetota bacterium]